MRKYIVQGKMFAGELIFGYNSEDMLVYFENNATMENYKLNWLSHNFPFNSTQLKKVFIKSIVKEITDLSFDAFWNRYNYKVGNKQRTEKLWKQLSDAEKMTILDTLPKYFMHLRLNKIAQAYPETYLNQRRWENEFKF